MKRFLATLAAVLVFGASEARAAAILTPDPAAPLTLSPGGVVGWGYDFTLDPLFEVVNWITFSATSPIPPAHGEFSALFDFPFNTNSQAYVQSSPQSFGLVELLAYLTAPIGTVLTSHVDAEVELRNLATGDISVEAFSFDVSATVVPEPATVLLLLSGLGAAAARRRVAKTQQAPR